MIPVPFEAPSLDQLAALLPAYDFDQLIAKGGMGAVYKARQRSLDRDVAIKILPRELGSDPLFQASFAGEAKAMARLSHSNLIRVYDYGDAGGLLYTVMEYVHGQPLYNSAFGKKIDPRQTIDIILATCEGLAHAHENGIVHRDIKPANILLNANCQPKIGDFGLARPTGHQIGGLVMGTPGYSAPEVKSHPENGDRRSDIFAVGIIMKEMLTGVSANSEDFRSATIKDTRLAETCAIATATNPAARFSDIRDLCRSLESWQPAKLVASPQCLPPRDPRPETTQTHVGRINWPLWKNCAVIAFLLVAIHLAWNLYTRKQEIISEQASVHQASPPTTGDKSLQKETSRETDSLAASSRY